MAASACRPVTPRKKLCTQGSSQRWICSSVPTATRMSVDEHAHAVGQFHERVQIVGNHDHGQVQRTA